MKNPAGIPQGLPKVYTRSELEMAPTLTPEDIELAAQFWEKYAPKRMKGIVRARPYHPSEFVPDVK